MRLSEAVQKDAGKKVQVVYMDRETAKFWNRSRYRQDGDPVTFTGYYWVNGREEGGPFKSRSAAYRDAWYRLVQGTELPATARQDDAPQ